MILHFRNCKLCSAATVDIPPTDCDQFLFEASIDLYFNLMQGLAGLVVIMYDYSLIPASAGPPKSLL